MTYEAITVDISENGVGTITLNRPEQMNTFNTRMAMELDSALRESDGNPDVKVIVLRGAGKSFSAGIDVRELAGKTPTEYKDWTHQMEEPLITMTELAKPVVAQVHGAAVANGTGVVAAADLAVASDDARFGLTAINVGLSCLGPVIPMTRLVGRKKALELLLGGRIFGAEEALEMGLVNKVVPAEELENAATEMAAGLAEKSPIAIQLSKQAFYASADLDYHRAFDYMNEVFARLCTTQDAHEGVAAFLEKRKPNWKGR